MALLLPQWGEILFTSGKESPNESIRKFWLKRLFLFWVQTNFLQLLCSFAYLRFAQIRLRPAAIAFAAESTLSPLAIRAAYSLIFQILQ